VERGGLTPYMWRFDPSWNIIAGSGSGYGVLFLTYWLRLFGISQTSAHLFMYLAGILTIPFIFSAISMMYGLRAAWYGTLFFVLSRTFFDSFYGRMDALGIFAYAVVLFLHVYAVRRELLWLHAIVGAAAVLAIEFHVLGILYISALGLFYGV